MGISVLINIFGLRCENDFGEQLQNFRLSYDQDLLVLSSL